MKTKKIKQIFLIYLGGIFLVFLMHRILSSGSLFWVLIPAYFLYVPMMTKENFRTIGLSFNFWKNGLFDFFIFSVIIFPLFAVGFYLFQKYFLMQPFAPGLHDNKLLFIISQYIYVAFPEEVFYRGYIQGVLREVNNRLYFSVFGCPVTLPILITSFMFALGHFVIDFNPARFSVFFPSLLFGCLKERKNDLTGSILFHGTSNIVLRWLSG